MEEKKKGITIRVPEDLHQKIKIHAIQQNLSLQEYILALIKKDMQIKD